MLVIFVFVHGGSISAETWNRETDRYSFSEGQKLGGECWNPVKTLLEAGGHQVYAPTLADEHSADLTDHITAITDLIREKHLCQVILTGHSYGGMIITGVAAAVPERIHRLVYIDAAYPDPGQSLFDLIRRGGMDPAFVPGLEPASPYVQKIAYDPWVIRNIPRTYLLCTESLFLPVTSLVKEKISTERGRWEIYELPSSHLPMASMPEELVSILLRSTR